jgi:aromatic ring-cleaving dioxygenase
MSRRNSVRRKVQRKVAKRVPPSLEAYFFDRELKDGARVLRKELVRRDELWGILEWHSRRVAHANAWYRVLWRSLKGAAVGVVNPFAWSRLKQSQGAENDRSN